MTCFWIDIQFNFHPEPKCTENHWKSIFHLKVSNKKKCENHTNESLSPECSALRASIRAVEMCVKGLFTKWDFALDRIRSLNYYYTNNAHNFSAFKLEQQQFSIIMVVCACYVRLFKSREFKYIHSTHIYGRFTGASPHRSTDNNNFVHYFNRTNCTRRIRALSLLAMGLFGFWGVQTTWSFAIRAN